MKFITKFVPSLHVHHQGNVLNIQFFRIYVRKISIAFFTFEEAIEFRRPP